jgi:hypothetical protein
MGSIIEVFNFDLNDGLIRGGSFWRITPQVNWYISKELRFELCYGYGVLDRYGAEGKNAILPKPYSICSIVEKQKSSKTF